MSVSSVPRGEREQGIKLRPMFEKLASSTREQRGVRDSVVSHHCTSEQQPLATQNNLKGLAL